MLWICRKSLHIEGRNHFIVCCNLIFLVVYLFNFVYILFLFMKDGMTSREIPLVCWFTLHMSRTVRLTAGPGIPSRSPVWVPGAQVLEPSSAASYLH